MKPNRKEVNKIIIKSRVTFKCPFKWRIKVVLVVFIWHIIYWNSLTLWATTIHLMDVDGYSLFFAFHFFALLSLFFFCYHLREELFGVVWLRNWWELVEMKMCCKGKFLSRLALSGSVCVLLYSHTHLLRFFFIYL